MPLLDKFVRDGHEYEIVDMGEVNKHGVRYLINHRAIKGFNGGGAGLKTMDEVRDYLKIRGVEWTMQLTLGLEV